MQQTALYILGELHENDLQWMIDNGDLLSLPIGTYLCQQDEPIDAVYILLDGIFAVLKDGVAIARLVEGDVVGEMALIETQPASAAVRVVTDGKVFRIAQATLLKKLNDDSDFAAHFYRALAMFLSQRLRAMSGDLESAHGDPEQLAIAQAHFQKLQQL